MIISIHLSDTEAELVKSYAQMHGITVSEFIRQAAIERIEDELDLNAFSEAYATYSKNPITYSLEEVEKRYDF